MFIIKLKLCNTDDYAYIIFKKFIISRQTIAQTQKQISNFEGNTCVAILNVEMNILLAISMQLSSLVWKVCLFKHTNNIAWDNQKSSPLNTWLLLKEYSYLPLHASSNLLYLFTQVPPSKRHRHVEGPCHCARSVGRWRDGDDKIGKLSVRG